jgi:hypothetical protein
MLTRNERRRLAQIELAMQITDPGLANKLKRFRPWVTPWRATAAAVAAGWLADLVLLSTGQFVIGVVLLTPLTAATTILWAVRI